MKLNKEILGLGLAALCLPALSHAVVYDIGTDSDVTFTASDSLTNTGSLTDWVETGNLRFNEGSDFTNVDFTALGITSWTTNNFVIATTSIFDGVNFSGLTLALNAGNNNFWGESFVGTNFSGTTLNLTGNQPFLFSDLTNANFVGATINAASGQMFRETTLTGADFSNAVFGSAASTSNGNIFNGGPGSTSIADAASAVNFSGVDFSNITGDARTNLIANLGRFDGGTAIGAFYDAATLTNSGVTAAALNAAGWQAIPEPSTYALLAGLTGLVSVMVRRRRS